MGQGVRGGLSSVSRILTLINASIRLFKVALGEASFLFHLSSLANVTYSPGRIHHCMRSIGAAQMALDLMIQRVTDPSRKTFGKFLYQHGTGISSGYVSNTTQDLFPQGRSSQKLRSPALKSRALDSSF